MLDDINPNMLILARESRSISQSRLAEMIGVSQGKLSKAEKGGQSLPKASFEKICKVLEYPRDFFLQSTPTAPVSHYYYRKRVSIPQKVMVQIEAVVKIYRQNIDSLSEAVELPEFRLPVFDPLKESPEEIAKKVRYFLRITDGPISNLIRLLENNGILIVRTDLYHDKIDGISTMSEKGNRIIFLNSRCPSDRERFSLAHELGHMLMHFDIPNISEEVEDEANRFASEFLLPKTQVVNSLRYLNLRKAGELKRYWKVSMKMLILRAHKLGSIDSRKYKNLLITYSKEGFNRGEPIRLPAEEPFILDEIVRLHMKELGYSLDEMAEITRLQRKEFENRFMPQLRPKLIVLKNVS